MYTADGALYWGTPERMNIMGNGKEIQYGNWVSKKSIGRCLAAALVIGALAALVWALWGGVVWGIVLTVAAVFFMMSTAYFLYARHMFSPKGGGVQQKVVDGLLSRIRWDGKGEALDIGCGSGHLAIHIARKFPEARVTGTDYWGGAWAYNKAQCENNAAAEGVADRMDFARASASKLPYPDESFDLVVSNMVFHEVMDTRDKRAPIKEALRVLKKGGAFVFQDLFLIEACFGKIGDLIAYLKENGLEEVHFEDMSKASFIPRALKLPFMLGTVGILHGVK